MAFINPIGEGALSSRVQQIIQVGNLMQNKYFSQVLQQIHTFAFDLAQYHPPKSAPAKFKIHTPTLCYN
jgi:hypothetical protein